MSILKVPIQINGGTDPFNTVLKERELYINTDNGTLHWGDARGKTQNVGVWSSERTNRIGWYDKTNGEGYEFKRFMDDNKQYLSTHYLLYIDSVNGIIKTNTTADEVTLNGVVINESFKDHYIDIVPESNKYDIGGMNLKDCTLFQTQLVENVMYGTTFPQTGLKNGRLFFLIKKQG